MIVFYVFFAAPKIAIRDSFHHPKAVVNPFPALTDSARRLISLSKRGVSASVIVRFSVIGSDAALKSL